MTVLSTGNALVDAMGQVPITGNATPLAWYRTIVRGDGKADRLAIDLLAHLVWWYRPYEARDEQMGFAGMRKKFRGDLYQCSYRLLGEIFNAPERSIRRSLELFESLGLARCEVRPLRLADGTSSRPSSSSRSIRAGSRRRPAPPSAAPASPRRRRSR